MTPLAAYLLLAALIFAIGLAIALTRRVAIRDQTTRRKGR